MTDDEKQEDEDEMRVVMNEDEHDEHDEHDDTAAGFYTARVSRIKTLFDFFDSLLQKVSISTSDQ